MRALGTANLADGLLHWLPGNIFHLAVALLDANNFVTLLDSSIIIQRSAGNNLSNLERTIFHLQHRAHSAKGEAHIHVEILLRRG